MEWIDEHMKLSLCGGSSIPFLAEAEPIIVAIKELKACFEEVQFAACILPREDSKFKKHKNNLAMVFWS